MLIGGLDCAHQPSRVELRRRVTAADAEMSRLTATVVELTQHRDQFHRERDALLLENEKRAQEIHALTQARLEAESPLKRENEVMRLERDQARDAFGAVVTSTSWRLTAPLRAVAQVVKDAPARAATHARRAAQAGRILRSQGPMALAARIFAKFSHQGASAAPRNETRMPDVAAEISPLNINSSDAPRISIVIPVYGQHLMTFHCLQSIAQTCAAHAIEIILVDDCSPESANVALASVTGVTLLRNETNLGFLGSCNAGAARARGEYLVLLNNDTLTKSGWLDALRDVFTLREDAGLVGAKLIYPDGALQEAGGIVWRDGSAWNVGRGDDASKPEYNYLRDVDYCSGACLMISRNLWVALGGFDLRYAPAYYEDTDLAFRVREAGKRVYYQPEAVIVHFEGRSAGTDLGGGMKRHQVVNQKIFFERWQNTLLSHRENGVAPQFERERRANKRILVIDACMLTPDQDSGSLRMFEILAAARDLGCKVTFVADNLEYSATYTPAIQRQGVEVRYHPYERGVDTYLAHHAAEFDVIVLSRVSVAAKHLAQLRRAAPRAKIIFDTVDLHFVREERASELVGGTGARIAAALTRKQELDVIGRADASLVVSPVEKALLATLLPQAPVHILSNIHVNMPGGKPFAERAGILFIGGFRHPPNLDAITWYVDAVLPILRARAPQLITTIIGSNAPSVLQKFAAPDFVIAGYVPDVEPYFRATRVAISPLRYGAGVKGKVNLAMQYGVPVVATSASAEGMYLAHETNVLIADTAASFADAILRVHEDEALWNKLVAGGHMNIEEHFSRTCARNALRGLLGIDASHR